MSSAGETSLSALLKSMTPTLVTSSSSSEEEEEEIYVFGTLPTNTSPETLQTLIPFSKMLFREHEAWTAILPRSIAESKGIEYSYPCRQITLNVHSSLDAVGFLAAITTRLAERLRIGVNPISGYYHDHLFVAAGKEDEVLTELKRMAAEQQ